MSYRPTLRETLRLRGDTNFDLALTERLLDVIEMRLRPVEDKKASLEAVEKLIRDVGLQRINDVLTPAIQSVLLIQERGFLMARSSTSATIAANDVHTFVIADEHERATFVPGPYPALTRDGSPNDTAVTRLIAWEPTTGELMVEIIAVFGDPGPHDDWVIVATAGVANAMQAMLDEMRALAGQVAEDRLAVADDRTAAQTARGEAVEARNQAAGFAEAAHDSAVAAASFDPSSYYPKTETYSKGEVDLALGEKLEADDLTAAATSFDNSGTELVAETVQAALAELDARPVGWVQIGATISLSGNATDVINIPPVADLMLVLEDVAHSHVNNADVSLALSNNNGSSFGASAQKGTIPNGQTWHGIIIIDGFNRGVSQINGRLVNLPTPLTQTDAAETPKIFRSPAQVDAVRFSLSGVVTFTAGTLTLFGRN